MSGRLRLAVARMQIARDAAARILQSEYPVGAAIRWLPHGRGPSQEGVVVAHSGIAVRVRNNFTGSQYFVDANRVLNVKG